MTCLVKKDRKEHAVALIQKLMGAREDEDVCNLVIRIDKHEVRAHRSILAVSSDYFKAMLNHDTVENKTGVVNMKDADYEAVKNCIDFLYSGEISFEMEHCEKHLHAASLMQLQTICDDIIDFLSSNVIGETFFKIKSLASKYDLERVHKVCDDFAAKHLIALAKEKEFDSLEQEYVVMLLTECKSAQHESEDDKMKVLLKWIKADVDTRKQVLIKMIETINLSEISKKYGKELATAEPLCYDNLEVMRSLYISTLDLDEEKLEAANENMKGADNNAILVFNKDIETVNLFDFDTQMLSENAGLIEDILGTNFATAVVGDMLFVLCSSQKVFSICWKRCLFKIWRGHPDMIFSHGNYLRCLHYDGYIYVLGNGLVEAYSLKRCCWGLIHCLNAFDRCAIAELRGVIYTIGGLEDGTATGKVCKYDPRMRGSPNVSSMSHPRATPGVCVYGDKIYVAGGFDKKFSSTVELYDPDTDNWTCVSNMTFARSNFALVVVSKKILACGRGTKAFGIEEYDPETGVWTVLNIVFENDYIAPATLAVKSD